MAARSHPQPETSTPVPSPRTALPALAAAQQQLLVPLSLSSPLPFGAQDPRGETSPFAARCCLRD